MQFGVGAFLEGYEYLVHHCRIGSSSQRLLLRPSHLRRRNHLHRFRDLRRIPNRFDPAANLFRVRHSSADRFRGDEFFERRF